MKFQQSSDILHCFFDFFLIGGKSSVVTPNLRKSRWGTLTVSFWHFDRFSRQFNCYMTSIIGSNQRIQILCSMDLDWIVDESIFKWIMGKPLFWSWNIFRMPEIGYGWHASWYHGCLDFTLRPGGLISLAQRSNTININWLNGNCSFGHKNI